MSTSRRFPGRLSVRTFLARARGALVLALLLLGGIAAAEGTRTLHPSGATGSRGVMDLSNGLFAGVAK